MNRQEGSYRKKLESLSVASKVQYATVDDARREMTEIQSGDGLAAQSVLLSVYIFHALAIRVFIIIVSINILLLHYQSTIRIIFNTKYVRDIVPERSDVLLTDKCACVC